VIMAKRRIAVVAVGGNTLTLPGERSEIEEELAHARAVARTVRDLVVQGWGIALTHGNGPQVGIGMRRATLARATDPALPEPRLSLCVAESQASIGLVLATAVDEELMRADRSERVVVIVTRAQVLRDDPAFSSPTKPIDIGVARRLVASPKPLRLLEGDAVADLIRAGHVVVAAGGGGVAVARDGDRLGPVDAVIDKDYASALLAIELDADLLAICTNVDRIAVAFGMPEQRWLDELTTTEARSLLQAGQFPPGNMGPKVEAALWFLESAPRDGRSVVVTSAELLTEAINGRGGTRLARSARYALV
jgi:carbamate kinase